MAKRIGRPPIYDVPATAVIYVRTTPDQLADLRQVARENHTSLTNVIREAVVEYIADHDERRPPVTRK